MRQQFLINSQKCKNRAKSIKNRSSNIDFWKMHENGWTAIDRSSHMSYGRYGVPPLMPSIWYMHVTCIFAINAWHVWVIDTYQKWAKMSKMWYMHTPISSKMWSHTWSSFCHTFIKMHHFDENGKNEQNRSILIDFRTPYREGGTMYDMYQKCIIFVINGIYAIYAIYGKNDQKRAKTDPIFDQKSINGCPHLSAFCIFDHFWSFFDRFHQKQQNAQKWSKIDQNRSKSIKNEQNRSKCICVIYIQPP